MIPATQQPPATVELAAGAPPRRSLVANASWTLIGNVCYAVSQGLWLVLLAHFVPLASASDFLLGFTIATPAMAFSSLALRNILATDTLGEFSFVEYMTLRLLMTVLSLLVIVLVPVVMMLLGVSGVSTIFVIGAVGTAKSIESISDMIFGRFLNYERLDLIGLSTTLKGVLSLVGFTTGALITHDAFGAALGLVVSWACVLLAFDLPWLFSLSGVAVARGRVGGYVSTFQQRTRSHDRLLSRMWQLGKRSIPLAFSNGIYTLNPNIVMYFARAAVGKDLFAIFATLQQLTAPGSYVMGAIGMAITPRLARAYANGRYAEFRKVLCYAIICVAVMGAAGLAFALVAGKWFLSTFFKPEYADYNGVLVWLVVAATLSFVAGILGFGATATRTFHRFVVPYLIISATALLGSALVVPRWEMFGAAMVFAAIQVVAAISFLLIMLWAGLGGRTADQ